MDKQRSQAIESLEITDNFQVSNLVKQDMSLAVSIAVTKADGFDSKEFQIWQGMTKQLICY